MRLSSEVRVGLIVTSGIAVLIALYWFLGGIGLRASMYPIYGVFPSAQKLDKGALVRMAGVKVGLVSETSLTSDNRARIDMLIDKGVRIAKNSVARVTTGGFIGEYYVEIKPGTSRVALKSGDRIATETLAQPERILEQASNILADLKKSTQGINELLGDREVLNIVKSTLRATQEAAESASELARASRNLVKEASPEVMRVLANLDQATAGASRVAKVLEELVTADLKPNLKSTLQEANLAMDKLQAAITDAAELMGALRGSARKLDAALSTAGSALTKADEMMGNFKDASENVKSLAADAKLQQDIRTAVHNAAEASRHLKELSESLNKKYGRARSSPDQHSQVPESGVAVNSLWNTSQGKYRVDANYTFAVTGKDFARVGVFNVGEKTGLNLQAGKVVGSGAIRYGLYNSRVGVGFDQRLGANLLISGDVYRPNRPEMELRGVWMLTPTVGLYGGASDVFHESERDVFLGIRYQHR